MKNFEVSVNGLDFSIDLMTIVLFSAVFVLIFLLYRAQNARDQFDLRDLITEKDSGRVSLSRFGQLVALMVSTWGFITLTLKGGLTEWYYASYMAVWAIAEGFRKWGEIQIGRSNKYDAKIAISRTKQKDAEAIDSADDDINLVP